MFPPPNVSTPIRYPAFLTLPSTSSLYAGLLVPTPIFPLARIVKTSEVVPTLRSLAVPLAVGELTEKSDVGVVVPIPTFPPVEMYNLSTPEAGSPPREELCFMEKSPYAELLAPTNQFLASGLALSVSILTPLYVVDRRRSGATEPDLDISKANAGALVPIPTLPLA
jgi:hypothetical protein